MWQIYALMAQDHIREQRQEADKRRLGHEAPQPTRQRRRVHLPVAMRHASRPSSRSA